MCLVFFAASCKKEKGTEATTQPAENYTFTTPQGFPVSIYDFSNNTPTKAGFELGRMLFYDPILSKDSSTSCGTCHKQYAAFADAGHDISHGIYNLQGNRNSPAIFNTAWWPSFFWDGGVVHIEVQPIAPITNPVEMDETLPGIIAKLKTHPTYPAMFKAAYGTDTITTQAIMRAFAQFMGLMISSQSKYDKVKNGEAAFTTDEQAGYTLFKSNCATCHSEPLFTDFSFSNNGLDSIFKDSGRYRITKNASDMGKFKVPSLRNIELTFPYMHDGRFAQLSDVISHYNGGIKTSATLDSRLNKTPAFTPAQTEQLIAFLKTLTDKSFTTDKRFSEPVK